MSTKKTRQLGKNKCNKAEDIKNFLCDSHVEEIPNKISEEQNEAKEGKNKTLLKTVFDGVDYKDNKKTPTCTKGYDRKHWKKESAKHCGILNNLVNRLYDDSNCGKKLSKSVSNLQSLEGRKSIFEYLEAANRVINSEEETEFEKEEFQQEISLVTVLRQKSYDTNKVSAVTKRELSEEAEDKNSLSYSRRKRVLSVVAGVSCLKRFKAELSDKKMSDIPDLNTSSDEAKLSKIHPHEHPKRRSIITIMEELEFISRKWKEGCLKYKLPLQWGVPIIKNCSEKWDSHNFHEESFILFQKRMEINQSINSSIHGGNSDALPEQNDSLRDFKCNEEDSRNEREKAEEEGTDALVYDGFHTFAHGSNKAEDDLSAFSSENQGKRTLRNRKQNRNRPDDRISNDNNGDHLMKEKLPKKSSHKTSKEMKRKPFIESESCQSPHIKYQNEDSLDSNRNCENKFTIEDFAGSASLTSTINSHYEEKSSAGAMHGNKEEQIACPICENKFEKNKIVKHASLCANEKYHD